MQQKIILASASPRRQQLLQQAEINFDVVVSNIVEDYPNNILLENVPFYIAKQKAIAVQNSVGTNNIIIGADTIVLLNNEIIGKPIDENDAIEILTKLNGKTHQVITGVCILKNNTAIEISETTYVTFHLLTDYQIKHYVKTYKPMDKAGAYAIQEWIGLIGIKKIEGCFYNVMGLPISKIINHLK